MERYRLICVLGPTASGKTEFAVRLAREMGGEILSADSRQVYRGMDIGTGKDLKAYGEVPYHLIDLVPAGEKYDVFRYQQDFATAFALVEGRGAQPILCGGSGLYLEAAARGYMLPEVSANPALRQELEQKSTPELIAQLASLQHLHNDTDYDTRQRLIRALEVALYRQEHPTKPCAPNMPRLDPKDVKYIGISVSREERIARIDHRLHARLQEGLVEEVQGLLDAGILPETLLYYGLEYKFVTLYLTGQMAYNAMVEQLAIAIHQFAKRQMTWFRGMERRGVTIEWITL